MLDVLMSPIDPSRAHEIEAAVAWHGRLMTFAWAFLCPLGVLIARFCKILPRQNWPQELDHQGWWRAHLILQYTSLAATAFAVWLVLQRETVTAGFVLHVVLGWAIVALAVLQVSAGLLRGSKGGPTEPAPDGSLHGDHYDMSRRRILFEYYHKFVGWALLGLAATALLTGMWIANAPLWMWTVIGAWWLLLAVIFATLQRLGYAVDTYQAIWGPDETHPGNRIKPIGFGISRRQ